MLATPFRLCVMIAFIALCAVISSSTAHAQQSGPWNPCQNLTQSQCEQAGQVATTVGCGLAGAATRVPGLGTVCNRTAPPMDLRPPPLPQAPSVYVPPQSWNGGNSAQGYQPQESYADQQRRYAEEQQRSQQQMQRDYDAQNRAYREQQEAEQRRQRANYEQQQRDYQSRQRAYDRQMQEAYAAQNREFYRQQREEQERQSAYLRQSQEEYLARQRAYDEQAQRAYQESNRSYYEQQRQSDEAVRRMNCQWTNYCPPEPDRH